MKTKLIIGLIVLVGVSALVFIFYRNANRETSSNFGKTSEAKIVVDAQKNLGPLSENYKPGVYALTFEKHPAYPYDKYIKDTEGGNFRNGGGYNNIAYDEETFFKLLPEKLEWMADQFEKIAKDGGRPEFEIGEMPKWLSSCPNFAADPSATHDVFFNTCPPTDYERWAEIVTLTVDYFKNKRGLDVIYSIWSGEAEGIHWSDDEDSFFTLYKNTVLAVRRVDPNARVGVGFLFWDYPHYYYPKEGGPLTTSSKGPMLRNFIRYASQTSLPELGLKKLPIDFVEHHLFDMSPHVGYWQDAGKGIRAWLVEFGYSQNTELFFEYSSPESGNGASNIAASFLASTMIDMGKVEGKNWPMYNDMFPFSYSAYWNVGLFNSHVDPAESKKDYIIRPTYNVFRLFTMLRDGGGVPATKIGLSQTGDLLSAVATKSRDAKEIKILISNFAPIGASELNHLKFFSKTMPSIVSVKEELNKISLKCAGPNGVQKECKQNYIDNMTDPSMKERLLTLGKASACEKETNQLQCLEDVSVTAKDPLSKTDVDTLIIEIKKIEAYRNSPRTVHITIEGVPYSGKAAFTTYNIDESHANSCSYNIETGRSDSNACGKNGAIDKMVEKAKKEAESVASKVPADERQKSSIALYFYGTYTTNSGQVLTTDVWIDKINDDPNVSLEGSKKTETVNITNGTFSTSIIMSPQSVYYLTLSS